MSTNTTIAQEIDKIEVNVSAINSSNEEDASDDDTFDVRVITVGCLVKLPVCDVFDEWTGRRNGIKDVYGVTEYL